MGGYKLRSGWLNQRQCVEPHFFNGIKNGVIMESEIIQERYQSVYQYLRVGSKEYAVLNAQLARERAEEFYNEALQLLKAPQDNQISSDIDRALTLATDFGSKDAPFLLSQRLLETDVVTSYPPEEVPVFLKIAAERGHAEAAFQLACCYAANNHFPKAEVVAADYFASFSPKERGQLAEYYFHKATSMGHENAIRELVLAYAYGRGYVDKNAEGFMALCEHEISRNNQSLALCYGAWRMGMTIEGKPTLPEAVQIPQDVWRALECLLKALRGKNLVLAQDALHLICIGMTQKIWERNPFERQRFRKRMIKEATNGNQLLALYLAWYSIPEACRTNMPQILSEFEFTQLACLVKPSEELAIAYLDSAFFGIDEDISCIAGDILSQVFGRCFMDDEGMLIWQ